MAYDLLIKNATVIDGSGGPRYIADVGVSQGRIAEIGRINENADEVIDADGLVLSPGFIDGHTHMDAQVAWDPMGSCSCWHGVTTAIMGNCGFALAPCPPSEREWFAQCLEAVEDIPVDAMMNGIDWTWETFPEYLDHVARLPKGINYGAYLGHSALRMYSMGSRALSEEANEDDLKRMGDAVEEAIRAGALGFSTSRANTHITPDGSPVASRIGTWGELDYLVSRMADMNAGILQVGPDISSGDAHRACLSELERIAIESGRPVMFGTLSTKQGDSPMPYQEQLDVLDAAAAKGARLIGQTTTRSINALFSFESYLPYDAVGAWRDFRKQPLNVQREQLLKDQALRDQLIADEAKMRPRDNVFQGGGAATTDPRKPDYTNLFPVLGVDWNDPSIAELAERDNKHPVDVMIDLALEADMKRLFLQPLVNETPDHVRDMLSHPRTLATFSDSGAHVCQEMGASLQTLLFSYWVRLREAFTLEQAVRMVTFDNARAWDLHDRGLIQTGLAADLVLFDPDEIKPALPSVQTDLPGGARRLVQKAEGIHATIVNGVVTLRHCEPTGDHPGVLLRGRAASV